MTSEVLTHAFEPFMQAQAKLDQSQGGLGLGLALVKGIVELHGGEVSAHSAGPGQGAEFVIRLPLETGEPAGSETTHERPSSPRRRVLIVEDDPDSAESLQLVLRLSGHDVAVALDGLGGLAAARVRRPEVLLCDLGLPGMDGYAVARAFREDEALRDTSLVALSGYTLQDDLERATESGFDRHMAKPPDLEELRELLMDLPGRKGPVAGAG
jgi:CheY-like chemotaxis protein